MNRKQKHKLPYCPTLGEHHMNWEGRHFRTNMEKRLRNTGAFLLPVFVAPPPNHTLIHRSLRETPKPEQGEIQDMLGLAHEGGLQRVLDTMDTRTTEHYRQQLFIAAIDTEEAISRLFRKEFITARELRGV